MAVASEINLSQIDFDKMNESLLHDSPGFFTSVSTWIGSTARARAQSHGFVHEVKYKAESKTLSLLCSFNGSFSERHKKVMNCSHQSWISLTRLTTSFEAQEVLDYIEEFNFQPKNLPPVAIAQWTSQEDLDDELNNLEASDFSINGVYA